MAARELMPGARDDFGAASSPGDAGWSAWSQAEVPWPRAELADYILVDIARARLRATSPSAQIEAPHRDALTWAQEQWVARCALVVPNVEEVLTTLGATPWL